ncbi:MAG: TRAP transporter small permease [Gammaproteobacteria bacterium]|nr:TRAP transporter small permease [Gammaproteobacteria bacterium]
MQPGDAPGAQKVLAAAERLVVALAQWALGAMLAVTLLDVFGRNLGRPLPGASELVSALLAVIFFAGAALAGRDGAHIGIGIAVEHYRARWLAYETLLTRCLSTLGFVFMAWMALHQGWALQARGVRTEFLDIPLAPIVYGLAFLAAIAAAFAATAGTSSRGKPGADSPGDEA